MKKIVGILLSSQVMLLAGISEMKTLYLKQNYAAVVAEAKKVPIYMVILIYICYGERVQKH